MPLKVEPKEQVKIPRSSVSLNHIPSFYCDAATFGGNIAKSIYRLTFVECRRSVGGAFEYQEKVDVVLLPESARDIANLILKIIGEENGGRE